MSSGIREPATTIRLALALGPGWIAVFTERLKTLREQRGLSQVQLAELLDVGPRVYNRWERGAAVPRLDTVVKIADILQVTLDELAGRQPLSESAQRVRNPKLHELYLQIDKLSQDDQHALLVLFDSLIKRAEIARLLAG